MQIPTLRVVFTPVSDTSEFFNFRVERITKVQNLILCRVKFKFRKGLSFSDETLSLQSLVDKQNSLLGM